MARGTRLIFSAPAVTSSNNQLYPATRAQSGAGSLVEARFCHASAAARVLRGRRRPGQSERLLQYRNRWRRSRPGQRFRRTLPMSPRAAGIGFVAYFFGLLNREGRVDSFGCDSEIYGELDVFWTEQADECLNPVRRRLSQPCSGPVTIGDRGTPWAWSQSALRGSAMPSARTLRSTNNCTTTSRSR
jgi:hypothetical protein